MGKVKFRISNDVFYPMVLNLPAISKINTTYIDRTFVLQGFTTKFK